MLSPSIEAYREMSKLGGAVPVVKDVFGDFETPLSGYWKLAHDEEHSFLLESVTGGEQLARYSYIGVRPRRVIRHTLPDPITPDTPDPLEGVVSTYPRLPRALSEGLPKFTGGAVGVLGYDYVRTIERLTSPPPDDLHLPQVAFMVTDAVVVFDHAKNLVRLIVLADGTDDGYRQAVQEIERLQSRLSSPLPPLPHFQGQVNEVTCNTTQEAYEETVRKCKGHITAGDTFQMLPSLRLETSVGAHPLTVYRALRSVNPSPYMFLLRFGDFDVVGASPELLVGLDHQTAMVRPIAGTRPRGKNATEDKALAEELLADEKERAEHIMLLDLSRNDLGRVCEYGSVHPGDVMVIEKYSHVMHIVSSVTGKLRPTEDEVRLIRATFPHGTVSGAPKVRAMELLDGLETTRRNLYAGGAGYLSATGDVDLAIMLRTIILKGGKAYVQAGAGVVFDSDPHREFVECQNKAMAAIRAIQLAQTGQLDGP